MSQYSFPYKVNLCVITKDNKLLLQKKRRGFGEGNWNGPGGKIEAGETPKESVRREVMEETKLDVKNPELVGEIEFIFLEKEEINNYCYIFRVTEFEGEPTDTGEGELKWFDFADIPYDKMWEDDKHWLPLVLKGEKIHKRFYFDKEMKLVKFEDLE